jgi:DNA-directed RNA polymerase subunit beta'
LINFVDKIVRFSTEEESALFLDKMKDVGFDFASRSGISISPFELGEMISVKEKSDIIKKHSKDAEKIDEFYKQGFLSVRE